MPRPTRNSTIWLRFVVERVNSLVSHPNINIIATCLISLFTVYYMWVDTYYGVKFSPDALNIIGWQNSIGIRPENYCQQYEILFCELARITNHLNLNGNEFLYLCSLIVYFNLLLVLVRIAKKNIILRTDLTILFSTLFWLLIVIVFVKPHTVAHLSRQYLAVSFVVLALSFDSIKIRTFLVAISALIHVTSLVFFIAILMELVFRKYKIRYIYFLAFFVLLFVITFLTRNLILSDFYAGISGNSIFLQSIKYRLLLYTNSYEIQSSIMMKWGLLIGINALAWVICKNKIYLYYNYILIVLVVCMYDIDLVSHRFYHSFKLISVIPILYIFSHFININFGQKNLT
jgi:hypothetical protein